MSRGHIERGWRLSGRVFELVSGMVGDGGASRVRRAGLAVLLMALGGSRSRFGHSCAAVGAAVGRHPGSVRRWWQMAAEGRLVSREWRGSVRRRMTTLVTVQVQLPTAGGPERGPTVGAVLDAVRLAGSLSGAVALVLLWESPDMSGRELGRRLGFTSGGGCALAARLRGLVAEDRAEWASRGRSQWLEAQRRRKANRASRASRGRGAEAPRPSGPAGGDPPAEANAPPPGAGLFSEEEAARGRRNIEAIRRELAGGS